MPDGEPIKVAIGRFGPYVQYGAKKFVSIKDDDPYTVELPRALELIKAKEELDANRIILDFPDAGIQVLNGRYGPYITDRVKNAKIPEGSRPEDADARRMQGADRRRTGARQGSLRQIREEDGDAARPKPPPRSRSREAGSEAAAKTAKTAAKAVAAEARPAADSRVKAAAKPAAKAPREDSRREEEGSGEAHTDEEVVMAPRPLPTSRRSSVLPARTSGPHLHARSSRRTARRAFAATHGSAPKAAAARAASCATAQSSSRPASISRM